MASILFKNVRICNSQFKSNFLKNEKLFLDFLFHFRILHQILNSLKQKIIVIANVFPKLKTLKGLLRNSLKGTVSEQALAVNMWKHPKCLLDFHQSAFIMFFLSFSGKLIWKMSHQVLCEILAVLLTYWPPMASILFKVVRICNTQFKCNYLKNNECFLNFLIHFLSLHQILSIFKNKMIVIPNVFPKLQTATILVRPLPKKRHFRTRFDKEHVKASLKTCKISMRAL